MNSSRRSPSYLSRNNYSFCFRILVPRDLKAVIGKNELKYSLKTVSLGLAKSRARLYAGNLQQFFRCLRESIKLGELKQQNIPDIVNNYIRELLHETELKRAKGDKAIIDELSILLTKKDFNEDVVNLKHDLSKKLIKDELKNLGIEFDEESDVFLKLCREVTKGLSKWARVEIERNRANYSGNIDILFPLSAEPNSDKQPQDQSAGPSMTLQELINEYTQRQIQAKKWRQSTEKDHKPKLRAMLQFLGDKPITNFTGDNMRNFTKVLELLPPGFAAKREYRNISGLRPEDLQGKHNKTLDSTTRRHYMNLMRAIFTYAVDCGYIPTNPVQSGFVPPKKANARKDRDPL